MSSSPITTLRLSLPDGKADLQQIYHAATTCGNKLFETYPQEKDPDLKALQEWETFIFGTSEWIDSLSTALPTGKKIHKIVERALGWLECRRDNKPLQLEFTHKTFENMEYSAEQVQKVVARCFRKIIHDTHISLQNQINALAIEYQAWKQSNYPGKTKEQYVAQVNVLKDHLKKISTLSVEALMANSTPCEKNSEKWAKNQATRWVNHDRTQGTFFLEFVNTSFENIEDSLERIRNATFLLQLSPE